MQESRTPEKVHYVFSINPNVITVLLCIFFLLFAWACEPLTFNYMAKCRQSQHFLIENHNMIQWFAYSCGSVAFCFQRALIILHSWNSVHVVLRLTRLKYFYFIIHKSQVKLQWIKQNLMILTVTQMLVEIDQDMLVKQRWQDCTVVVHTWSGNSESGGAASSHACVQICFTVWGQGGMAECVWVSLCGIWLLIIEGRP